MPDENLLNELSLQNCPVDDAGAAQIARLVQLRSLDLTGTKITDDGFRALAPLTALELLAIDHTQVGDAAIGLLASWPKLSAVTAVGTKITKQAAKEFNTKRGQWVLQTEQSYRLTSFSTLSDPFFFTLSDLFED